MTMKLLAALALMTTSIICSQKPAEAHIQPEDTNEWQDEDGLMLAEQMSTLEDMMSSEMEKKKKRKRPS